jgi:hypothetical protein
MISDFIQEIARELDARAAKPEPGRLLPADKRRQFVKLLTVIGRDLSPTAVELREKLERIAVEDLSFQKRCAAMLPTTDYVP